MCLYKRWLVTQSGKSLIASASRLLLTRCLSLFVLALENPQMSEQGREGRGGEGGGREWVEGEGTYMKERERVKKRQSVHIQTNISKFLDSHFWQILMSGN